MKKTTTILVTGGAGYIGSVVVAQLIANGYSVVAYDSLVKGHKEAVDRKAIFVQGDISDSKKVKQTLEKYHITAVMHFAAFIEAGESMKVPEKYFHNNTKNTLLF